MSVGPYGSQLSQPPAINPLTADHLAICNKIQEVVPQLLELAGICKECGLPVDDFIDRLNQYLHTACVVKERFFPGQ